MFSCFTQPPVQLIYDASQRDETRDNHINYKAYDSQRQMRNSNNDETYKYMNQQSTYTFRTNDQYRSSTLDKRHRQTVHNQTLTLHTAHQSECKGRISMKFEWKYYNEMDNGYGTHKMIWKWEWMEWNWNQNQNVHYRVHIRRKCEICRITQHNILMYWNIVTIIYLNEKNFAGLWRMKRIEKENTLHTRNGRQWFVIRRIGSAAFLWYVYCSQSLYRYLKSFRLPFLPNSFLILFNSSHSNKWSCHERNDRLDISKGFFADFRYPSNTAKWRRSMYPPSIDLRCDSSCSVPGRLISC